jgi:DNA (cytosine-5)-methyltransferase 1
MRFVDLFAGLGGFHLALRALGHRCVFASEIDEDLCELSERNFGLRPAGDMRKVNSPDIPDHDILCAGFPCQPFSKAGEQLGTNCPHRGDLFGQVVRVARYHQPKFLILENVANLEKHNGGRTWAVMHALLVNSGYHVDHRKLSPHRFGIPQIRERLFIVGSRRGLTHFAWPEESDGVPSVARVLDRNPRDAKPLPSQVLKCLAAWQDFITRFPAGEQLPSFPIWTMEFGANYPYAQTTPFMIGPRGLRPYKGAHGVRLADVPCQSRFSCLPSYARTRHKRFPRWKVRFIQQNRLFYLNHKKLIDQWVPQILPFPPSLQKFEWNCKGEPRHIWKYVLQFRASGVRVKRPTTAPSLIAMTTTQVPIVGWEKRYMTPRECSRLQSMEELPLLPEAPTKAYKALGNAVNVDIVRMIAESLCGDGRAQPTKAGMRRPRQRRLFATLT